jgi:hypothetical protein
LRRAYFSAKLVPPDEWSCDPVTILVTVVGGGRCRAVSVSSVSRSGETKAYSATAALPYSVVVNMSGGFTFSSPASGLEGAEALCMQAAAVKETTAAIRSFAEKWVTLTFFLYIIGDSMAPGLFLMCLSRIGLIAENIQEFGRSDSFEGSSSLTEQCSIYLTFCQEC